MSQVATLEKSARRAMHLELNKEQTREQSCTTTGPTRSTGFCDATSYVSGVWLEELAILRAMPSLHLDGLVYICRPDTADDTMLLRLRVWQAKELVSKCLQRKRCHDFPPTRELQVVPK